MNGDKPEVEQKYWFVSHTVLDKVAAYAVIRTLERAGAKCWVTPRDFDINRGRFAKQIEEAIISDRCLGVISVYSENAERSEWVPQENEMARQHNKPVIPFSLSPPEKVGLEWRVFFAGANIDYLDDEVTKLNQFLESRGFYDMVSESMHWIEKTIPWEQWNALVTEAERILSESLQRIAKLAGFEPLPPPPPLPWTVRSKRWLGCHGTKAGALCIIAGILLVLLFLAAAVVFGPEISMAGAGVHIEINKHYAVTDCGSILDQETGMEWTPDLGGDKLYMPLIKYTEAVEKLQDKGQLEDEAAYNSQVTDGLLRKRELEVITQSTAKSVVTQLDFCENSDWRLPTVAEAGSLFEKKRRTSCVGLHCGPRSLRFGGYRVDPAFRMGGCCAWTSEFEIVDSTAEPLSFSFGRDGRVTTPNNPGSFTDRRVLAVRVYDVKKYEKWNQRN